MNLQIEATLFLGDRLYRASVEADIDQAIGDLLQTATEELRRELLTQLLVDRLGLPGSDGHVNRYGLGDK